MGSNGEQMDEECLEAEVSNGLMAGLWRAYGGLMVGT